jgi:aminoglycoside phosphotransferase (APT) family kinase protein
MEKLSGGITNKLQSFLLTFVYEGIEKRFELVLKAYDELTGLWLRACRPGEDRRRYFREFQVLQSLEAVNFLAPKAYLCEVNPSFLGYPFIIMSKEKAIQENGVHLHSFASALAQLHNLEAKNLRIESLKFPKSDISFAVERCICLRQYMAETRHYRHLRKVFDYAIKWLESNANECKCSRYCLVHGEYHPGHTLITTDNKLEVIDWESAQIGDPAFDVGYAYHMIKLMNSETHSNNGKGLAERFISEYSHEFRGDIYQNLEFYKIVGLLGVAEVVSSYVSCPVEAYKRFGNKALVQSLVFPVPHANYLFKKWLNDDFLVNFLSYSLNFIETFNEKNLK